MKTKILFFACLLLFVGCKKHKEKKAAEAYKESRKGIMEMTIHNNSPYPLTGFMAYALRGQPGNGEEPVNKIYLKDLEVGETFKGDLDFKSLLYEGEYWYYMDYMENGVKKDFYFANTGSSTYFGFASKGRILTMYGNDTIVGESTFW